MLADLRYGFRTLFQAKGWTAVVLVSIAIGIGANTALFSAVNGLLLRKVPVRDPDSLVRLRWAGRNDAIGNHDEYGYHPSGVWTSVSYSVFRQLAARDQTLAELFAGAPLNLANVVVDGRAELADAFIVTGNYYRALGIKAHAGRTLLVSDDQPQVPAVAVLSYRYWQARFGASRAALGTVVRVNNVPVTIVGVLPPEFTGVQRAVADPPDITVPLALEPLLNPDRQRLTDPMHWWLQVAGRLRPGITPAQAQANLEPVFQHTARTDLSSFLGSLSDQERSASRNQSRSQVPRLRVESASRGINETRPEDVWAASILAGLVFLVLLLVCANVANLLLSRCASRQKEISTRLSLGASRGRLVRQLLTESVVLAGMGGLLGLAVADWGRNVLPGPPVPFDWRVAAFAAIVTMATGIAFGLAPAVRASRIDLSASLKENGRVLAGGRNRLGRSLVAVQVAISLVLLVGTGLLLRSVDHLRKVDVGFDARNIVLLQISPGLNGYDEARIGRLYESIVDRVRALPGVQGAAVTHPAPLSGHSNETDLYVGGRTYPPDDPGHHVHSMTVSAEFFDVMGVRLLAGRSFTSADHRDNAPKVAVVNEAALRMLFADRQFTGQTFGTSRETTGDYEVVGVVRDMRYESLRDPAPPTIYLSSLQRTLPTMFVQVRTAGEPSLFLRALREAIRGVDPDLPVMNVSTQSEQIERRFTKEKFFARACLLFGAVALLLAAVGLFGLLSYSVVRRTNEIGIRMALGARADHVRRLIVRESMTPVLAGVAIGLAGALAAGRLIRTLLFGIGPADPVAIAGAMATLLVVAAAASYLPARRASRIDPLVALRHG